MMTTLAALAAVFMTGMYFGMWLEHRHQRRLEIARVWRPQRAMFCEAGHE